MLQLAHRAARTVGFDRVLGALDGALLGCVLKQLQLRLHIPARLKGKIVADEGGWTHSETAAPPHRGWHSGHCSDSRPAGSARIGRPAPPWRPCILVQASRPHLQHIGATPAHDHSLGRVRYAGLHGASNATGHDGLARVLLLTTRATHCKNHACITGRRVNVVWHCRYRPPRETQQALRSTNASFLLGACATITLLRDVSTGAPGGASSRWIRYGLNKLDIASVVMHSLLVVVVRVPTLSCRNRHEVQRCVAWRCGRSCSAGFGLSGARSCQALWRHARSREWAAAARAAPSAQYQLSSANTQNRMKFILSIAVLALAAVAQVRPCLQYLP
jgi:hypothetical protein